MFTLRWQNLLFGDESSMPDVGGRAIVGGVGAEVTPTTDGSLGDPIE
jgi:hypothetical protein